MKRDHKMTIRFGGAELMRNGHRATDENGRMHLDSRALSDRQSEAGMRSNVTSEEQERTFLPQSEDEIQALERLIRHESGTIADRERMMPNKSTDEPDRVQAAKGPSVWKFPEPIRQIKVTNVETEQKLFAASNRIEDGDMVTQHSAPSVAIGTVPMSSTGLAPVVQLDNTDLPQQFTPVEDKPYSISDWDLGSLEGSHTSGRVGNLPSIADYSRIRSRGPSWLKVFASVAGAIATGALFGYLALALFAGQGPWSGGSNSESTAVNETAVIPSLDPDASSGNNGTAIDSSGVSGGIVDIGIPDSGDSPLVSDGAAAVAQVNLKAQSFHALQYGVFSSAEGADMAVSELADQGLAAYRWDTENDFRVYVGMSSDRDGALALSQLLNGIEVYVKEIELPAVQTMPFSGDAQMLQNYWSATNELIEMLDRLTLGQLELGTLKPFSADQASAWKQLHEQWLSASSAATAKLTNEQNKKAAGQLAQAINTAAVSLAEFDKKPSASHLWNAQSALMAAVFAEKGWLESSGRL
ncbi:SPOR domain-containing protein [Paenibacillus xylaniclasticus]|uniref:SPOR domain-containing protein n=1 Tax=Paenibacillus xylaniclasticus TaxID=588083 RepID=UPI000FDAA78A|nr:MULTISPECIES: SPOR domain-containing protein [Paenibacillus]GFN33635.1 hypothetical protein PCURB6_38950 [Paenibacillus curdlanolyticus]